MKTNRALLVDVEARIILTNACNFRCIFCHGEGIGDVSHAKWEIDTDQSIALIDQALELGCKDITLTGGEPLLQKKLAQELILHVDKKSSEAAVTMVSNLSLLDEKWLSQVAGKAGLRINVSMHTLDAEEYLRVTGQKKAVHLIDTLKKNLQLLRRYNVPFKLNCVALRSLVNKNNLQALCDFAENEGAKALKILEMLVMENSESLFSDFISLSSIEKLLPADFSFIRTAPRRRELLNPNGFTVELQKCRCRFGCNNCLSQNTANLNSAGKYWPCFEGSDSTYSIQETSLSAALDKGYRVLEKMAERYGNHSPSLIRDIQPTSFRQEVFFIVEDMGKTEELLKRSHKVEIISFNEDYYQAEGQDTARRTKVRTHLGDPENARMVLSKMKYQYKQGMHINYTEFLDDNPISLLEPKDLLNKMLEHLGWQKKYSIEVDGHLYRTPENVFFSISTMKKTKRSRLGEDRSVMILRTEFTSQAERDFCHALQDILQPIHALPDFFDSL